MDGWRVEERRFHLPLHPKSACRHGAIQLRGMMEEGWLEEITDRGMEEAGMERWTEEGGDLRW